MSSLATTTPPGRLPHTVYASESQVPPQDEYDVTKGFTYMYLSGEPLFAFGHGLSYTTFKYGKLELSDAQIARNGRLTASVDVTNTGKREGDEVVQLYVHEVSPAVKRPVKELRGFERISLKPGETKKVTFTVPAEKLAYYDETTHSFVVKPGAFDVLVGSSSQDIRAQGRFTVAGEVGSAERSLAFGRGASALRVSREPDGDRVGPASAELVAALGRARAAAGGVSDARGLFAGGAGARRRRSVG